MEEVVRPTVVYDTKCDRQRAITAAQNQFSKFANLFQNLGDVEDGFSKNVSLDSLNNKEEYSAKI